MGARIVSILAVLVLVAGCTSKPKDANEGMNDGSMAPQVENQYAQPDKGYADGTQQQLVVEIGDRVFFGYDRYDLTPEARMTVERQAQWLNTYPNVNVLVEGHCDERGTREYNIALGEKRATAVRNYLVANGVSPMRLQVISYGKERPAVLGSDETSWAQNRRGALVVQ